MGNLKPKRPAAPGEGVAPQKTDAKTKPDDPLGDMGVEQIYARLKGLGWPLNPDNSEYRPYLAELKRRNA